MHRQRAAWIVAIALGGCGEDGSGDGDGGTAGTMAANDATGGDDASVDATAPATGDDTDDSDGEGGSSDDGAPAGPHALGTIELGESHSANGGSPTPFVSASFIPDATDLGDPHGCAEEVSGCFVQRPPECDECDVDEYCAYDDGCVATCTPLCDADCDADEICVFASPGRAQCRPIEDFDAGILAFGDTAIPVTLVPPYSWSPETSGSPFLSGATILVQAGGAAAAGFAGFEQEFTATTLLQTEIDDITVSEAYGDGPVPVRWVAGQDDVVVTVSAYGLEGNSGSATCPADDTTGAFDVPRAAIEAVLDGDTLSSLGVGVRRTKTTQIEGLATKGMLTGAVVQPEGWLRLSAWSMEQHDVQGCAAGEAVCDDECVDVQFGAMHCGDCDTVCEGACEYGECVGAGDSCAGVCGEMAPSGCWCNATCQEFGDCCPDYARECG